MRLRAALGAALLTFSLLPARAAKPDGRARADARRFGLDRLERRARRGPKAAARRAFERFKAQEGDGGWRVRYNPKTGDVESIAGGRARPRGGRPRDAGRAFLREQRELLSVDPEQLEVERESAAPGHRHVLYRQRWRGLPVEFARVKVHLDETGGVIGVDSRYEPEVAAPAAPLITADAAAAAAAADAGGTSYGAPELVVLPLESTGRTHLAWKTRARGRAASWIYYVDASTGQVLFRYNQLRFASGTIRGETYPISPAFTPVPQNLPMPNQWVWSGQGATLRVSTTNAAGFYDTLAAGKMHMSLQGPYVAVSNFRGHSAHWHSGGADGTWSLAGPPLSSARPYPNSSVVVSTLDLTAIAPNAAKMLPIFTNLNVGVFFGGDADNGGDIIDDDEVTITDGDGRRVASYVGNRGSFRGPAVAGRKMRFELKSNAAGVTDGFDVSGSSVLTFGAPGVPDAANESHVWVGTDTSIGLSSEIHLFYHLNRMRDWFAGVAGTAGALNAITGPVPAMAFAGPNLINAFYNPEYDNLMFGDVSDQAPEDLFTADATVSHHEYAHYLVEKIWSMQNFGQAGAISEAMADYFSASSLNVSAIGTHANGGFPLRQLDCTQGAPSPACPGHVLTATSWVGEIHDDSPFLSQALWEMRQTLEGINANGQECTDALAFQSLYFFPESFPEIYEGMKRIADQDSVAACVAVNAASAGSVQSTLLARFTAHGLLLSAFTVNDPFDTATGRNDSFETAVDVTTRPAVQGAMLPAADQDFYTFSAGPGLVTVRMSLPPNGGYYKAYQMKLYDRSHRLVAAAEPPYDGLFTINGACESNDCNTTRDLVSLSYNNPTGGQLYLHVSGGDTLDGSSSGVQSATPYGLTFAYARAGALASTIVSAAFDNDTISFTVDVTTHVSVQDWRFSDAQLRDHTQAVMPGTTARGGTMMTLQTLSEGGGRITGQVRLVPGFAQRFPSIGTVHLEVFGYNVRGSTVSLGMSNAVNLAATAAELTAYNNVFNPARGDKATIKYATTQAGRITIKLYTITGTYIATLLDQDMPAGKGSVDWAGRNTSGAVVASGIYMVRISAPGIEKTQKIAIVK